MWSMCSTAWIITRPRFGISSPICWRLSITPRLPWTAITGPKSITIFTAKGGCFYGQKKRTPGICFQAGGKASSNRKNVLHDETGLCRLPFSFTWFCVLEYGRELPAYLHKKITETVIFLHLKICFQYKFSK